MPGLLQGLPRSLPCLVLTRSPAFALCPRACWFSSVWAIPAHDKANQNKKTSHCSANTLYNYFSTLSFTQNLSFKTRLWFISSILSPFTLTSGSFTPKATFSTITWSQSPAAFSQSYFSTFLPLMGPPSSLKLVPLPSVPLPHPKSSFLLTYHFSTSLLWDLFLLLPSKPSFPRVLLSVFHTLSQLLHSHGTPPNPMAGPPNHHLWFSPSSPL